MRIHLFNWLVAAVLLTGLSIAAAAQSRPDRPKHQPTDKDAIRAVMDKQAAAWNRGDIEGFMDGYARTATTTFVSGDHISRGWQAMLERYHKSYDTRAKMGTLTFSELEITLLGKDGAVVLGKWELQRDQDHPHGYFTLIFRKIAGAWRIVIDHTSSAQ